MIPSLKAELAVIMKSTQFVLEEVVERCLEQLASVFFAPAGAEQPPLVSPGQDRAIRSFLSPFRSRRIKTARKLTHPTTAKCLPKPLAIIGLCMRLTFPDETDPAPQFVAHQI